VQRRLAFILDDGLHDADGEPLLRAPELVNLFARATALRLLPLKDLFDLRMTDHVHARVVREKPLDEIGERRRFDATEFVARERRRLSRLAFASAVMRPVYF
jgi:hypothetical protein